MLKEYSIDTILNKDIKICQPEKGFRFSIDSIILSNFVKYQKKIKNIIDIGSGCGIISILLFKLYDFKNIDAVEYQDTMYNCLVETIKLNRCENAITPIKCDIRQFKPEKRYGLIISNPPYRSSASGKTCDSFEENIARFTDTLTIKDIFKFAGSYLENLGSLYLSYDADLTEEVLSICRDYHLEPKRMMFFHPDIDKPAKLTFIEFKKGGKTELKIEPPLFQKINGEINKKFEMMFKKTAFNKEVQNESNGIC